MEKKGQLKKWRVLIITFAILFLYLLGVVIPNVFWAFHYPAFLPGPTGLLIILLGAAFIALSTWKDTWVALQENAKENKGKLWLYGTPIIAAILFYQFPIYFDVYGDARFMVPEKGILIEELDQVYLEKLFSLDFLNPKLGTGTVFGLMGTLSYYLGLTVDGAFRLVGAICGGAFVFFMLLIVRRLTAQRAQRVIFTFLILGTPITQVFCGHFEVYAPVYALLAMFWYLAIRYFDAPSAINLILLGLIALLNFKFHVTGVVIVLLFGFILIAHFQSKKTGKPFSWSSLLKFGVLPVYAIGGFVYFFVTNSAFSSRNWTEDNLLDAIFLPISSSDAPPLDRYNLFSPSHLFDFFSLLFIWSAGAVLIIFTVVLFYRKRMEWNNSIVQFSTLAVLFYLPLFFVLNPLLSMQTDWDLMSVPGVALMILAIALLANLKFDTKKELSLSTMLVSPMMVLFVIGISGIFVNNNADSEARRLISSGGYSFKTYWMGASTPILQGIELLEDGDEKIELLKDVVEELKPYAIEGSDIEYSAILSELGVMHEALGFHEALEYYTKAYEADPLLRVNVYRLVVAHFMVGDAKGATMYLPTLAAMQYPDKKKSLRVAIHVSLEAEDYTSAEGYCEQYLLTWADDALINKVLSLLKSEQDKSQIKLLFKQA